MDRRKHTEVLQEAGIHTISSRLLQQRLVLLKPCLQCSNGAALRAAIWPPMPWESSVGGLVTARLRDIAGDLDLLLRANKHYLSTDTPEARFTKGIELLAKASKKQIDKVLSFDCSHLSTEGASDRQPHTVTVCHLCSPPRQCKGESGLRIHQYHAHNIEDPRRASITGRQCPACLRSFEFSWGSQYA